jgi:hypothetical protein
VAKKKKDDNLTPARSMEDFKLAWESKRALVKREKEDFLFALGEQWSAEDKSKLDAVGIRPFTDNRIQPNIFLLTGLERQNRTDFKAFPIGEEDGLKAEIASALFKDAITKSGFGFKSSEQFKDGITCGESHLEPYLDYTESIINGKLCWRKIDGDSLFPDPASREYDFSDAKYVYKISLDMSRDDLISLYPEKAKLLEASEGGKVGLRSMMETEKKDQKRGYRKSDNQTQDEPSKDATFDLVERYYKKWVKKTLIGDKQTGEIKEAEDREKADASVAEYVNSIAQNQAMFDQVLQREMMNLAAARPDLIGAPMEAQLMAMQEAGVQLPPPPPEQDPERFFVFERTKPEIWVYAHTPGINEPLADERAWFFPKWKQYPFVPYFARFSTAPLSGDDRHLLIQGIVHGVKGAQEKHNKSEMLTLRHLNSSANSGWLSEEGVWIDPEMVKKFGTSPGVNLEYKKGAQKPERITPGPLSQGHAQISAESAQAIKEQLGINADLLATQQGGADSGRAIALRQKQGLLMVQEPFDNLSRSRQIAGRIVLSQMGEMYDTETAKKVLGMAFLRKNFPVVMLQNPDDPQAQPKAMPDEFGKPMEYDKDLAELAIAEVLSGTLADYDVSVGEAVSSETQRLSAALDIKELAASMPGRIPPTVMIRHSQIPESAKAEILQALEQQQAALAAQAQAAPMNTGAMPGQEE